MISLFSSDGWMEGGSVIMSRLEANFKCLVRAFGVMEFEIQGLKPRSMTLDVSLDDTAKELTSVTSLTNRFASQSHRITSPLGNIKPPCRLINCTLISIIGFAIKFISLHLELRNFFIFFSLKH